jgi:hypothetical protein
MVSGQQKHLEEEHWSSIIGACLHYACFHRQKTQVMQKPLFATAE